LSSKIKKNDFVITLDKEGISLNTEKLRSKFEYWISSSSDLSIIIGGPDGLSKDLIKQSDFCLSLSQLTFPHSIVPVLALEQIYRVWSMTQNHPYHK
jgi:23S rRNA (pseudouridine1915-N3)-methyltransferase